MTVWKRIEHYQYHLFFVVPVLVYKTWGGRGGEGEGGFERLFYILADRRGSYSRVNSNSAKETVLR